MCRILKNKWLSVVIMTHSWCLFFCHTREWWIARLRDGQQRDRILTHCVSHIGYHLISIMIVSNQSILITSLGTVSPQETPACRKGQEDVIKFKTWFQSLTSLGFYLFVYIFVLFYFHRCLFHRWVCSEAAVFSHKNAKFKKGCMGTEKTHDWSQDCR